MIFPLRTMVSSVALSALLATSLATAEQDPSFNCSEKITGSMAELICQNPGLAALDRKLATIYRDAISVTVFQTEPPSLTALYKGQLCQRVTLPRAEREFLEASGRHVLGG
ncbi:hypothetical protein [Pseudomonas protegens]|uniref:hypothetical protein n=1 Tax=Pseudomonas protegens TaxID=380021 RepID=UPI001E36B55A|nr:hypothetical protein [Pseudomonas protegens]MCD9568329.1 hypothetical protein [Pseudomonas protegens]